MKLEKIELRGFKSFFKKVDLHFPSSITAIVGPNGCGKSNVADAINWALGEQSTRRLRVQKMEDLIFNGSENRKPLGMAEVVLKMNTDDHENLVITRRLFRLGEAEYRLNGTPCLLRDIQEKLLGSGLGAKSYYSFDQSDIELVLSPYPDDRRKLLEEAAGISKYKLKKRLAENKLAYARQNLLRLNDIIGEVKNQISSLKRQVARGRRYQRLSDELWRMKGAILVKRFHRETDSRGDLLKSVSSISREIEKTNSQLSLINSELLNKRQDIQQLEDEVLQLRESLHKESLKEATLGSDTLHYQSEIDNLHAQLQESNSVLSTIEDETKKKDELLKETIRQKSEHQSHLKSEKEKLSSLIEEYEVSKNERQRILASDEDNKKKLYHISGDINQLQALLNQINENKGRNLSFLKENSASKNKIAEELRTLRNKKNELRKELDCKKEELQQFRKRLKSTRQTLEETLREQVREERRLINREAKIRELSRRLHTLEELEKQEALHVDSRKGLEKEQFVDHLGLVADHINVDPRYEKGVEAFLDTWLSCLVVADMHTALQGVKYLSSKGLRGGSFLVKELTLPQSSSPLISSHSLFSHPGVIAPLRELVSINEPFKDAVERLLERAVMVENLDVAVELFSKYPEFIFITLKGEQIYPQGVISRPAKGKGVGLLAIKRAKKSLRTGMEIIAKR
ncbi:MAG: AAA family ATPase, partial [Candidatus Aminicenantes bacterium]|nr:AAA family ATPase [Candidatus Aminicenantes bacterium]